MSSNPTIILITGAFHVDSHMHFLSSQLEQDGYSTRTMGLVTVNNARLSVEDDVTALRTQLLIPLIKQQGKDVVLYLHSYAGIPGSTAIEGFSKAQRAAKGQKGGIIGLIYQSAFTPTEGRTLIQMIGGAYAPWQDPHDDTGLISVIDPKNTLYGDVPEPLAGEAVSKVKEQSILSFNSPCGPVYYADRFYDGRRVYIYTNLDQALPTFLQDKLIETSGTTWDMEKLNTSHTPFISQPVVLAKLIERVTGNFERTYSKDVSES